MLAGLYTLLFISSFILVAISALALAVVAWRRSQSTGSLIFALMMVVVVIWLAATAVEQGTNSVVGKVLAVKIGFLGISWIGVLWLAFSLEYVFPERNYFQRFGPWMSIGPLINIAIVMTNELHGFVWNEITALVVDGKTTFVFQYRWWSWVFIIFTYLLLTAGSINLFLGMFRFPRSHRRQAVGLLIGMALPWIANALYLAGLAPKAGLDITPFAFALTGVIYAWTLFRYRLFDLAPLVHEFILENVGEGYLVIDNCEQVVEVNQAAIEFLGLGPETYWGKAVTTVLAGWPVLLDLLHAPAKSTAEIPTGSEPPQYLEATLMDWYKGENQPAGCIILLRDVTRRHKAEESLRESERMYRLVVNTMPVGIAITDEFGRITFASPKLGEIFLAQEDDEYYGKSVLKWIHANERGMGMMRLLKVIEEKENLPAQEYRFVRSDGSVFWGEVISTPMLDNAGNSKGLLAIVRDVSQRKELEFRLQYNLAHQTFINRLLQTLYRAHDVLAALDQVLQQTGSFARANRLYLCKDSPDGEETSIILEWCSVGIPLRAREGPLFRYKEIPTWRECLKDRGMLMISDVASAPEDIAEFLATWNVLSLAVFPIYGTEERLYGFLAFDYCDEQHEWTDDDLEVLWNVCRIISGAVAQRQYEEAEQRQRILAEVLHDTASALNSTLNVEEVLDQILNNLERIAPHDAASISLVDEEGMLKYVRWRGYDAAGETKMKAARIPVTQFNTFRRMAETGEPIIISDTWLDKNWVPNAEHDWIRSYAGMPIHIKGQIAGFINLDRSEPDSFSSDLVYSLHVFADQAAVAIENARLYDSTRKRAEEMTILNHIGLTMTTGLEMKDVLISLCEKCREILPIDVFYVALYDAETGMIELPFFYQDGQYEQYEPRDIHTSPGITGIVIQQRRTISLHDTLNPDIEKQYHIIRAGGQPSRSYVGVPLILLNQVVGVISMQSFQPYAYSIEQVRLLETIATQAAIVVQNARLYDKMKQLAITDSVTQLFTRRQFSVLGRGEVERALRYNRKLSLFMLDIDRFKRVNDTYGHTAGDQALLAVANICKQALRVTDIVGRWGGEEYVIILPEADRDGATLIAERVRRMVAETDIIITLANEPIHVTISIGVAVLGGNCQTLETLIDSADRALYAAKQGGRNQVQVDQ